MAGLDMKSYYEAVLDTMNKDMKSNVEHNYPKFASGQDLDEKVDSCVVKNFQKMDRGQVFLTGYLKKNFADLKLLFSKMSAAHSLLISPSMTHTYAEKFIANENEVEFIFSTFKRKAVKTEEGEVQTKIIFYCYSVYFEPSDREDRTVFTMKLPRIQVDLFQQYDYSDEIVYFEDWLFESFQDNPYWIDLKKFVEELSNPKFEKSGFDLKEVEHLKEGDSSSDNRQLYSAGFKLSLPPLSAFKMKLIHRILDDLFVPDLIDSVCSSLELTFKNEVNFGDYSVFMEQLKNVLARLELSSSFFETIHRACLYGTSQLRYTPAGDSEIRYNLEYKEDSSGLVRSSKQNWANFEYLYKEIKKHIEEI